MLKFLNGRLRGLPTDFGILKEIYVRYKDVFHQALQSHGQAKIYIPVDIRAIAQALNADADIVFGRLYYHMSPKYSYDYMTDTGKKEVIFFALDQIPGKRHCVQFPLMSSVLASLSEEHDRFMINTRLSIIALLLSLLSLGVALVD